MPTFYAALDNVSRELVGLIPASTINAQASGAAYKQEVKIPITTESELEDIVASDSNPKSNFETIESLSIKITKMRRGKITWTGEEQNGLGALASPILQNQIEQRMRAIVNEMEADLALEAISGALAKGNFIGTAGTAPFQSDLKALTLARKVLSDKGSPLTDLQLVLNTEAGMNLRNLSQLQKVSEAGSDSLLRQGLLGNLYGFNLRESAGFQSHKNGDASGYLVNGGAVKGVTEIAIDSGTGSFKRGDIIYFGTDKEHKYVVANDIESGSTVLKLTSEIVSDVEDDTAITIDTAYTASAGFSRGSLILATRVPYVPAGGDNAMERQIITDPVSGISFELAVWGGAYQNTITIGAVWGCKNIKGDNTIAILG